MPCGRFYKELWLSSKINYAKIYTSKHTQIHTHTHTSTHTHSQSTLGHLLEIHFRCWLNTIFDIAHNIALCFIMRYLLWKAASSEFHLNFARQGSPSPYPPPSLLGKNIIYNLHLCISQGASGDFLSRPFACPFCCFVVYTLPETVKRDKEEIATEGGEGQQETGLCSLLGCLGKPWTCLLIPFKLIL